MIGNIKGNLPPSNIQITEIMVENYIQGIAATNGTGPQNVAISNCIIGSPHAQSPLRSNQIWNELTFKNNIIIGFTPDGYQIISGIENSVFENCIFIEEGGCRQMNGNNCAFRNCMFTGSCAIMQNSIAVNCIFGVIGNIFVDHQDFVFNSKSDFHLLENSPGKNAGTDGTDIGIYGGRYPWKDGGLPINPHIDTFNVGGTTETNGTLKVSIKVAAQDH